MLRLKTLALAIMPLSAAALIPQAPVVAQQASPVAQVQSHLRAVSTMTANFTQTDSRGRVQRGTLQLKRPGRIRFEYGSGANMPIPDDLQAAIDADPVARRMLDQLSAQNRFALAFRMHSLKTAAGREKRIAAFVDMLRRGETPHPQKAARTARGPASGADPA